MKIKLIVLTVSATLFLATTALAARPVQFASDTFTFYLLLNITIGSLLIFFMMIFVELYRERRQRKRISSREFVERRRQGTRSNGYAPVGEQMVPVTVRVERERRIS